MDGNAIPQEEQKNDGSSLMNAPALEKHNSNMSMDSDLIRQQEEMFANLAERNNIPTCGFCQKPMKNEQQTTVVQSTECYHQVHLDCFKQECID